MVRLNIIIKLTQNCVFLCYVMKSSHNGGQYFCLIKLIDCGLMWHSIDLYSVIIYTLWANVAQY